MEDAVVLYPSPGMGHLVPTVELAKLILLHRPSLSVTMLITIFPVNTTAIDPYISHVSAETPSLKFHHLPVVHLPDDYDYVDALFDIPRINSPDVRNVLQSIAEKSKIRAFIMHFFCNSAFEVSSSLEIPTYYLSTVSASGHSVFIYQTVIDKTTEKSLKDLNAYLHFPGTPPIFSSDMPEAILDRNSSSYKKLLSAGVNMLKSRGIIANSFEALEPRAIKALADGLCVPDGETPPPVYCVGPLISTMATTTEDQEHECIKWLNSQPSRSVVFLCFGSLGLRSFEKDQLYDMAIGLENSGLRFIWVVRCPSSELDTILPEGFLDRTKGKGLVLNSWAPQMEVLNHDSVGGFVTHCGWNSILEAVWAGVPMLAWPLYAEQKINRVFLVEEFKLGLGLTESENGFVSAAELERQVRELMESESGKVVRQNVLAMRDAAKVAMSTPGSSRITMENLITVWKQD